MLVTRNRLLFAVCLLVFSPGSVRPQTTIVVTTSEDDFERNGNCTFREAVSAALHDVSFDSCAAGTADDEIDLSSVDSLRFGFPRIELRGKVSLVGNEVQTVLDGPWVQVDGLSGTIKRIRGHFAGVGASIRFEKSSVSFDLTESQVWLVDSWLLESLKARDSQVVAENLIVDGFSDSNPALRIRVDGGRASFERIMVTALQERPGVQDPIRLAMGAEVSIFASTFVSNASVMVVDSATIDIVNSTFVNTDIVGVRVESVRIRSSTINRAPLSSFGRPCVQGALLTNSVLSCSSNISRSDVADVMSLGYNFIGLATQFAPNEGDQFGVGTVLDPMLSSLRNSGGPTPTMSPVDGSPLIDAGSCSNQGSDQRGFLNPATGMRTVDDPTIPNANDGCDIGAIEVGAVQGSSTDIETDERPDIPIEIGLTLSQPYPNPSSRTVVLEIGSDKSQSVRPRIHDALGRIVMDARATFVSAGAIETVSVNVSGLSSGVYFVDLDPELGGSRRTFIVSR